jgi:hypothetical protein
MSEHINEPWILKYTMLGNSILDSQGCPITYDISDQRGERIIKCVNACKGMKDPEEEIERMKRYICLLSSKLDKELLAMNMDYNIMMLKKEQKE